MHDPSLEARSSENLQVPSCHSAECSLGRDCMGKYPGVEQLAKATISCMLHSRCSLHLRPWPSHASICLYGSSNVAKKLTDFFPACCVNQSHSIGQRHVSMPLICCIHCSMQERLLPGAWCSAHPRGPARHLKLVARGKHLLNSWPDLEAGLAENLRLGARC